MTSAAAHRRRRSHPAGQLPLDALWADDTTLDTEAGESPDTSPRRPAGPPTTRQHPPGPALPAPVPAATDGEDAPPAEQQHQQAMLALAGALESKFRPAEDPWAASPYAWLKNLPSVSRARAATALVAAWATHTDAALAPTRRRGGRGLLLGPHETVVKVSTQWSDGSLVFQGLTAGPHERVALLGVRPHTVNLWLLPSDVAVEMADPRGWLTIPAAGAEEHHTLHRYGGPLEQAGRRARALLRTS